jgi:hypothetical protein
MTNANWCVRCGVAHGDSICLLTSSTLASSSSDVFSAESKTNFPFTKLPTEIRLDIYDQVCAAARRDEACQGIMKLWSGVDTEVSSRQDRILLEADRLNAIVSWIKGPYSQAFHGLILSNKELNAEVKEYIRKANAVRIKSSRVEIIWFEDLGHLLTNLGPVGRENLINIVFTWDNLIREAGNGTKVLSPAMWRDANGPARIFRMLAACKNLTNITARIDTYRLMHAKPDGSWRRSPLLAPSVIPGMKELRKVKGSGVIKIEHSSRTGTSEGPWSEAFQKWIMDGMKLCDKGSHDWGRAIKFAAAEDKRLKKKACTGGEDVEESEANARKEKKAERRREQPRDPLRDVEWDPDEVGGAEDTRWDVGQMAGDGDGDSVINWDVDEDDDGDDRSSDK